MENKHENDIALYKYVYMYKISLTKVIFNFIHNIQKLCMLCGLLISISSTFL